MARVYVVCYLDKFYTEDTGDIGSEGEFYFKCNKKRYPDEGIIKLGKKETFDPDPNPTLFCGLYDSKKTKDVKFDIEVWEEDPGRDDKMVDKEFKLPLSPMNEKFELSDKKKKCTLTVVIKIEEVKNW